MSPSHVLAAMGVKPELADRGDSHEPWVASRRRSASRASSELFPALDREGAPAVGHGELTVGERVLVAMSGGVDSSVAAALLVEQGYDVVGATMKLFCYGDDVPDRPCCSLDSINDARRVCEQLGVPHYVLNLESAFGHDVIDDFVGEYARGPHADSLRSLQHVHEVPRPAAQGGRDRRALDRHRPLRANAQRRAAPRPRHRRRTRATSSGASIARSFGACCCRSAR